MEINVVQPTNDILISVICNAFNHVKYIREALEGFIMQKTDFAFEVLVHDDASTDGTQDIIREYEQKYPDLIKPIYQTENQYSKGKGIIGKLQLGRAQGKYIAICEGDDYWTDPYKLQKQFDVMEKHPEVDMCAHGAICVAATTGERVSQICPSDAECVLNAEEVIRGGGGFLSTNSLFYRKELNNTIPEFRKYMGMDYTLQIHGSLRGGIYYLPDMMSAYRVMTPGSWTDKFEKDENRRKEHFKKMIRMYELLSVDTNHYFDGTIQYMILKTELKLKSPKEQFRMLHTKRYSVLYKKLSVKEKLKLLIKSYFPKVETFYRKIKK